MASSVADDSFAVLALLPKSSRGEESNEPTLLAVDGVILLFSIGDPIPVATWFVRKVKIKNPFYFTVRPVYQFNGCKFCKLGPLNKGYTFHPRILAINVSHSILLSVHTSLILD